MPGGNEPKAKKRRKGGDRRDKEKPLLSVQVGLTFNKYYYIYFIFEMKLPAAKLAT